MTQLDIITEEPLNAETAWTAYQHPLTPVDGFFKRNHAPIPHLDQAHYRLRYGDHELTLPELMALPHVSQEVVLECAGNARTRFEPTPSGTPWGIKAVSNALWEGITLESLLQKYPPPSSTVELVFRSVDRAPDEQGLYARSLTHEEIAQTKPMLAWSMNDKPLSAEHGAPVRLIVPGYYGMASIKWLAQIECWDRPFDGYFQVEDYHVKTSDGQRRPANWMPPKSLLTEPQQGALSGRQVEVRGWAWSGRSPIASVQLEVVNGGQTRTVEAFLEEDRGQRAWRGWVAKLELQPGPVTVTVFAGDQSGQRQPRQAPWNEDGYENNSAHSVSWTASA